MRAQAQVRSHHRFQPHAQGVSERGAEMLLTALNPSLTALMTHIVPRYAGSPYLKLMIGARARAATIKIMPRDVNG